MNILEKLVYALAISSMLSACGGDDGDKNKQVIQSVSDPDSSLVSPASGAANDDTTDSIESDDGQSGEVPESGTVTEISGEPDFMADELEPSADFVPDGERIVVEASSSEELYVEESFDFQFTNEISLTVEVNDEEGRTLGNTLMQIYSIPKDVTEWNDELWDQASLLISGKTDSNGYFSRQLELFRDDVNLLISLDVIGFDSKAIVRVDKSVLVYRFN